MINYKLPDIDIKYVVEERPNVYLNFDIPVTGFKRFSLYICCYFSKNSGFEVDLRVLPKFKELTVPPQSWRIFAEAIKEASSLQQKLNYDYRVYNESNETKTNN